MYGHLSRADKIVLSISYIFRLALAVAIVNQVLKREWMLLFLTTATLFLTFLPAMIERNYKITVPVEFTLITTVFIYMSMFLGTGGGYYHRFSWWDKFLHGSSGIVLGFVGFLIVYVIYSRGSIKAKPFFVALFAFCFAVSLGAIWEIYEFSMDQAFHMNLQHRETGIIDTMEDLIVDTIGALIVSIAGYFYVKGRKAFIFDKFVERFVNKNPAIFGNEK